MSGQLIVRLAIAIVVVLTIAVLLVLFLVASDLALSVRDRLQDAPPWLFLLYVTVLVTLLDNGSGGGMAVAQTGGQTPQASFTAG
jgi:hypothetical protein